MYPEFAYSTSMQLIVVGISFISSFVFVYSSATLILQLYGGRASARQKSVCAFLIGVVLDSGWVYFVFILGGMRSFSDTVYLLVIMTNPLFALLYMCIWMKTLNLPPVRSIRLIGYVYMYFMTAKGLSGVIGSVFFAQKTSRFNYMLDALNRITFLAIFLCIFFVTLYALRHDSRLISIRDRLFSSLKKEVAVYFLKATVIYFTATGIPMMIPEKIAASCVTLVIFVLGLALTIMTDLYRAKTNETENIAAHISTLRKQMPMASGGAYSELSKKMNENPPLISILLGKYAYAEQMGVRMGVDLNSDVVSLYIGNLDACVIIDCLLDAAIENAAASEQKWVFFSVEPKGENGKLMIVNNSAAETAAHEKKGWRGKTGKRLNHSGELEIVWKTIERYGNCIFHTGYSKNGMSSYLETKQNRPPRFHIRASIE